MPTSFSSKPVLLHPRARAEVLEATRYYRERRPELGARFLAEVRRSAELIQAYPEASPAARGGEVRRKGLKRFPYNLVYVIRSDHIRIVAAEHQSRRPGSWTNRL
jgi:plasmid stabilization system protein ParE